MRSTWTRDDFRRWVAALTLATEPWLSDVLVPLGIRPGLVDRRGLLEGLCDEATTQGSLWTREDDPRIVVAVGTALRHLAAASSVEDAQSFQRWTRRHFVCRDAPIALYVWRQVLQHTNRQVGGIYAQVPLQEPFAVAINQAAQRVTDEKTMSLEDHIRTLAPSLSESDIEIGLDLPSQALAAIEVAQGEATMAALVLLAKSLTPERRKLASHWAEMQALALHIPPDRLGGERFLSEEPACLDAPPAVLIEYALPIQ